MYNAEQRLAIESKEEKIVIIAPPGSGKTHTMVGAIQNFIRESNPEKVIAVTFTKKAAEELKGKIFNDSIVHTATIHSWSYTELANLSTKHKFRLRLLQEDQIMAILKPIMKDLNISVRVNWKLYHYVMGNYNIDIPDFLKQKFKSASARYIEFKRTRHLYDFTDLPLYLKDKLEEFDEYIYVDGLFVDEFQDVDPIQLEVFDRVMTEKAFFIGDPDQAIYIFRGATSDIFHALKGFKIYKLKVNYRSYQPILDFASSFKSHAEYQLEDGGQDSTMLEDFYIGKSPIEAFRREGGAVSIQDGYDFRGLGSDLVYEDNAIMQIGKEIMLFQPQILCRTNKQVDELKEIGYEKVSTIHKAKGLEFENVIVCDFGIDGQENVNVAYVALTRAQNRLMIVDHELLKTAGAVIPEEAKKEIRLKKAF